MNFFRIEKVMKMILDSN